MKKIIYIPAILLLAACSKPKDKKAELAELKKQQSELSDKIAKLQAEMPAADSARTTDVGAVTVKTGNFTNYVEIQGKIDAQDNVTAYPQAQGTITNIYVKPGQHVSKGQTLAVLDSRVLKQNILQAESQVSLARTLFQRQKNLWDQKIGTEVQFLQAQTNLEAVQKQLDALREQNDLYRIVSPINGTIDQMDLKLGQAASPGQTGIRIVNADNLRVKADVPESYATSVAQGNKVKIVFPDANDSLITNITFAAKVIDPVSRSFGVEIKLPSSRTLRPNMTAVLKIADYSKNNVISVPIKAVQNSGAGNYVYVNANGVATRKTVTLGSTSNGQSEILAGLASGDQVIVEGASDIEEGDKVRVIQVGK
ncbi:efflux RND transporter periplasmic adaptor subunit [Mucilaginibacter calamicampi]|uniref:Efflux RND transporter periplasmic adaptor subunit n=1 Tax=Mucilaginibacter calamicampi TaxID=1302352 RepID=A0ABW2YYE1_9SPHI